MPEPLMMHGDLVTTMIVFGLIKMQREMKINDQELI